jgi:hypothetical protein
LYDDLVGGAEILPETCEDPQVDDGHDNDGHEGGEDPVGGRSLLFVQSLKSSLTLNSPL